MLTFFLFLQLISAVDAQNFNKNFASQVAEFADINSGSKNLAGLIKLANKVAPEFKKLGFKTEWNLNKRYLSAVRKPAKPRFTFLLVYHLDTVFEADHAFQKAKIISEKKEGAAVLSGPGVIDDKGGLVLILELLRAFQKLPENEQIEWKVFGAADEETGSELSKSSLIEFAKGATLGLVFEPGWFDEPSNSIRIPMSVGGNAHLYWKVKGIESHAGINFEKGRSAIRALAEHILFFENLTNPKRELYFNVGQITGGTKLNVRPGEAEFRAAIRFRYESDEKFIEKSVEEALEKFQKDGIKIQSELFFRWHPQTIASADLFQKMQKAASELGQRIPEPAVSLARSGSSILAAAGIPTLDAMGPYGSGYHSDKEVLYLSSALPRLRLIEKFLLNEMNTEKIK
ncbi:MAG: M20/M25/M40 family metallo-hydrolase [Deltaproteobacteria bacterium]|nr:M20/M25/M40 family metallo-hydrolase [Deltaproteobacteria bacterium]